MYHIVKDFASSITMSSEKHPLTALFQWASHFPTPRVKGPYPGKFHVFVLALLYLFGCLNEWRQHSNRLQLCIVIRFRKRQILTNCRISLFQTWRLNKFKLGQLTCFTLWGTSWTSPKYTGDIYGMFVAGVVRKRKGFFWVLILPMKKNKSASDPSSRPSAGRSLV